MNPSKTETPRRTAVVTGASSGIGDRLARRFAEGGFDLVLVARREDRLNALAVELAQTYPIKAHVLAADLARPEAPREIVDQVQNGLGLEINALVNNAGFANHGPFAENAEAAEMNLVQVNIVALMHLTRLVLPGMIARRKGWILNVASTAGFGPGPLMANYYASKAYVLSFSEAVAAEVEPFGVKVTALCPGPTETAFADVAGLTTSALFRNKTMDADAVARMGYDALMRGQRVKVTGLKNQLLTLSTRLAPRRLFTAIAHRLNATNA